MHKEREKLDRNDIWWSDEGIGIDIGLIYHAN